MVGDSDIGPGYSHLESIARVPSLNRLILGLLLAQPERLHLRDVLIHDAQFPRSLAGELQLKVHDRVVALILVIEFQFVAFGLGEEERRWAIFHRLRFHQLALVVEGDAAGVQRPRDFLPCECATMGARDCQPRRPSPPRWRRTGEYMGPKRTTIRKENVLGRASA